MTTADLLRALAGLADTTPILIPADGGARWLAPGLAYVRVSRAAPDGSRGESIPGVVICHPGQEGSVPEHLVIVDPIMVGAAEGNRDGTGLVVRMGLDAWAALESGHPVMLSVPEPVGRVALQRRDGGLWLGAGEGAVAFELAEEPTWEAGPDGAVATVELVVVAGEAP